MTSYLFCGRPRRNFWRALSINIGLLLLRKSLWTCWDLSKCGFFHEEKGFTCEFPSFSWLIKYFSKEIFGETKSYYKANLIDPRSLGRGGLGFISHILLIHSRYFCSLLGHDSLSPLEVDNLIFNHCWLLGWRSIFLEVPRSRILVLLLLILDSRVVSLVFHLIFQNLKHWDTKSTEDIIPCL